MTILKYLKDRWLLLIGWLFFLSLTCFILWLAPNVRLDWAVAGYIFLLQSVFLPLFLTIGYYLKREWWLSLVTGREPSPLQEHLNIAEKEEELLAQTYIDGLLQERQQTIQQAINSQRDQKDYIDSWVHEIKVPLAAITLLVQPAEDDIPEKKYCLLENELGKIDEYVE